MLCLGDEEGVAIVKDAIRQIVEVHTPYGIPFFHIGADEAFEVKPIHIMKITYCVVWSMQKVHGVDGQSRWLRK